MKVILNEEVFPHSKGDVIDLVPSKFGASKFLNKYDKWQYITKNQYTSFVEIEEFTQTIVRLKKEIGFLKHVIRELYNVSRTK